jgi:magnesium transporter
MDQAATTTDDARELAVRDVPCITLTRSAADALRDLAARRFDRASDVVVLENDRPVGVVPLERVVAAQPDSVLEELIDGPFASIAADADQEHAAALAERLGTRVVAVEDPDGRLAGLVPP